MSQRTYYDILGVPRQATPDLIQSRYRALARQWHPDVSPDKTRAVEVFAQINRAYQVPHDPQRRAAYDRTLPPAARPASRPAAGRQMFELLVELLFRLIIPHRLRPGFVRWEGPVSAV